ncbi:hypothetical protein ACLOJK_037742 [Asimina triloba]
MVDSFVSKAVEKLTDVLSEKIELFAGATEELEKLRDTFQSIQAIVADAGRTRVRGNSVQLWLSRLRQVADEIDKLLDDRIISASSSSSSSSGAIKNKNRNKVGECLSFILAYVQDIIPRYKMAVQIKDIRERLDQIAEEKNRYFFVGAPAGGGQNESPNQISSRPLTTSLLDESEIISMEEDKEAVISRLLLLQQIGEEEDDEQNHQAPPPHVQVIAIVGGGKSGKTDLARQIFHDGKVLDFFDQRHWVCVADVFDAMRLTKAILEQVNGTGASLSELNSVQCKLVESVRGKRFLLVLDDVWNEDDSKWDMLRVSLKSGAPGSKILVTTRSDKVAKAMDAAYIHKLQGLS